MKGIIAVNRLGLIGLNGGLPWESTTDLKHFKTLTSQSDKNEVPKLLVGYRTNQTLPKLKGREVVVDNDDIDIETIDWCIGGKKTYEKYCKYFTELHISIIHDSSFGDTYYPDFHALNSDCKIYYYHF